VLEDGRIVQCVPEARRAWHAGASSWLAINDINSHSIGIEIVNPGHEHGYRDFPPVQVQAVIALCADILSRRAIRADRVLAHSDVAPLRKQDPGEKFPWRELHRAGIGHWVEPAPIEAPGSALRRGNSGSCVEKLQQALRSYGYALSESSHYGPETESVVRAFQRHFRPGGIDGIADASTQKTLDRLLKTRPAGSPV
jgi:N-acetylmuramoyl-L-alanine amidase